jgi:hypothetical protein
VLSDVCASSDQEAVVTQQGVPLDLGLQASLLPLGLAFLLTILLPGLARACRGAERPVRFVGHLKVTPLAGALHPDQHTRGDATRLGTGRRNSGIMVAEGFDQDIHASSRKAVPPVLTRLIGSDAVIEFSEDLLELIGRVEAAFPAPDWAVLFNDAEEEDEADELVICRRYSGVLMPVSYVDLDEIAEMEQDDFDWLKDLQVDLARTEAQLEDEIAAAETAEDA